MLPGWENSSQFRASLKKRKEKKKSCFSNIFRELSWWKVLDLKLLKVIFLRENIHFGPRMTKLMTPCSLKLLAIKEKTGVQVSAEATKLNPRQLCRWFAKVMMSSKTVSEWNSQWCYHDLFGFFLCFSFPIFCSLVLFPSSQQALTFSMVKQEGSGVHRHCTEPLAVPMYIGLHKIKRDRTTTYDIIPNYLYLQLFFDSIFDSLRQFAIMFSYSTSR